MSGEKGDSGTASTIDDIADALVKEATDTAKIAPEDAGRYRAEWYQSLFGVLRAPWMLGERVQDIQRHIRDMPSRPDVAAKAFVRSGKPFPKPDWSKWGSFLEAPVLDAVALSCDVAPESIAYLYGSLLPPEIARRYAIAMNHAQGGGLAINKRVPLSNAVGSVPHVKLADFAAWAIAMELPLPRGLSAMASPKPGGTKASPKGAKPLATKERTSLLVIIASLAKKAGLDISKPTVAAKAIIRIARDELGVTIGARTVENALHQVEDALDRKEV